jgi:microsomal dipeptidase-like Zn-dependent dipeptidase
MRNMYYVDMHCHSAPKPYSWYIRKNKRNPWECRNVRRSIWYNDPPRVFDKTINRYLGLTRFTQSDFRTQTKGDVRIMSACLSPIERALVIPKFWPKILFHDPLNTIDCLFPKTCGGLLLKALGPLIIKVVGGFSMKYIYRIRRKKRDYFTELCEEYKYYISEESKQDEANYPYIFKLTSEFHDIDTKAKVDDKDIIYIFFSIEGCHVLNNGGLKHSLKDEKSEGISKATIDGVKEKIEAIKKWTHPPLYVSIAHHMNNDLCGHAKSLTPPLEHIVDYKKGMGDGFAEIGKFVLEKLLSKENGNRIFIDIKHMSVKSRYYYYHKLKTEESYIGIPVFASHGAVNGEKSLHDLVEENECEWVNKHCDNKLKKRNVNLVPRVPSSGEEENGKNISTKLAQNVYKYVYQNENKLHFNEADINYFNDEIIMMEETRGFLGIQIDERRLCSQEQKKVNKKIKKRGKQLYHQAGLVWKQIRYIAELLDEDKRFGWGTAAVGSDFDGLVDPPNGYWSSEDFGILEEHLIHHAYRYFMTHAGEFNQEINRHPAGQQSPTIAKTSFQDLGKKIVRALARTKIRAQAKDLSKVVKEIKELLKELDNDQSPNNDQHANNDQPANNDQIPGKNQDENKAKALVKVIFRALAQFFGLTLFYVLFKALKEALTKEEDESPKSSGQSKEEANANAKLVIDLFMRGNALRFLKDFYKDNRTNGTDKKEKIKCPELLVK